MSILTVNNLKKHYPFKKAFGPAKTVKALDGVSFNALEHKTLGIVGESGCGKSTLARQLMGLETPTEGSILFDGQNWSDIPASERHSTIQMIFQDPYNSLNPRKKCWQLIAEPLFINTTLSKEECYDKVLDVMKKVGLRPEMAHRYPHMFSGGQRQRIGIARALVLNPKILICDEPVSALDVSIQAQVLNLLIELQDEMKLTYLFISHDLHVVKHISDEIMVMYLGKVVEYGPRDQVFNNPQHPYTKALLAASPKVGERAPEHNPITGELPSPLNPPSGCAFHKRCPLAQAQCQVDVPVMEDFKGRKIACLEIQ